MFIPKFFPFMSSIGETEVDNGGGENGSTNNGDIDDLGVPADFGQESHQEQTQEVKLNPAWNAVLEPLPQEFHKVITPKLQEWDTNFAKVQSDFAPYKPLLDNNVKFEDVQKAFQLVDLINSNPRAVYDQLAQRFGFNSGQGQQQIEDNKDDDPQDIGNPDGQFDITKHPQFIALQQQVEQFNQFQLSQTQSIQRQQEEQRIQQEIAGEFQALEGKVGKLADDVKAEIIRRAVAIGDARGDGNFFIEEGYRDYATWVNRVRNSRANANAPTVMPGNGGQPNQRKSLGQMSDEDRVDRIAEMAQKLAEGQNM